MNIALIFAGGVGKRMHTANNIPKQFLEINQKPIIVHTIENFQKNSLIDEIIVVMLAEYIDYTNQLTEQFSLTKVVKIVPGGRSGQESIYSGLNTIQQLHPNDNPIVLIHDGVRPIIEKDLIERNIKTVKKSGSAISSIPAYETEVTSSSEGVIDNIIDRNNAWIARAPQSFYLNDILSAHMLAQSCQDNSIIDSCSMIKKYGNVKLHIVPTIPENIKVTTPIDYSLTKILLNSRIRTITNA